MKALGILRSAPWILAFLALAALVATNAALQPSFFAPRPLRSNLASFLPLVLAAIGQTYVILAGDIDLSVGGIVALANVVVASLIVSLGGSGAAIFAGLAAGIGVGLVCGLANGLLVAGLRLQPIVATFATGILFSATALWVLPTAGAPVPAGYWRTYGGFLGGVPTVLWILILALIFLLVFSRTALHGRILAVGGDRAAAFQSGLRVGRIRVQAYLLTGLFSALAALCLTGETASGDPLLGKTIALSAISAVALGGTALAGGYGGAFGSVLGAFVLGMIGNVVFFAGLPFEYQTLVQGLIVLLALAGGVLVARR